jgi:hypothetical protein
MKSLKLSDVALIMKIMSKEEMTKRCREGLRARLDLLGMNYERVPGRSARIRFTSGMWKEQDWTHKTAHMRCSSLKNDGFYPRQIRAYGWAAEYWGTVLHYDLLICGAYSEESVKYYVFDATYLVALPDIHIRFTDVRKRVQLFQSMTDLEAAKRHMENYPDGRHGVVSPLD